MGRQVAEALEAAHHAGVIHRDLKLANIRVRADGTVKVLDFGIAKRVTTQSEIGDAPTHVTLGAGTAGTPEYMAPELLRGGVADARSDIFGLGVVLFMLVTGQHPFRRASVFETAEAILSPSAPHWPSAAAVPAALRRVIATAIAKDPAQRWATAREVGAALSVIDEEDPEKAVTDRARQTVASACCHCGDDRPASWRDVAMEHNAARVDRLRRRRRNTVRSRLSAMSEELRCRPTVAPPLTARQVLEPIG